MFLFASFTLVVSQSAYLISEILYWLMPLFLISSAPTRLFVFSSVIMGQNLGIRPFGISTFIFTFCRNLLHHITLLQTALLNAPAKKSLIFCSALRNTYIKDGGTGFLTLLPLLMAMSILPEAKCLPINGYVNPSRGKMPPYILYGYEKRLPYDVLVHSPVYLYSLDDYSKLQLHCFQTIHNSVREKLKASREEMLRKQHSQATPLHYDVGDSVMKRAPDRSCKLTPKFSGPYLLTAKLHGNKFRLLNPSTKISEVVHVNRLKKARVSFTPAAVPSSPSPTDLPFSPDARRSHGYRLRSAERH